MKPKELIPTEEQDQMALAELLDSIGLAWFHVPNEIRCKPQYLAKRKRLGVKAGVSDNFILSEVPNFPLAKGAVIELKRVKGGVLSPEQRGWLACLSELGWETAVCKGIDQAIQQLKQWGYLK
jgi:hypothetical protein